MFLKLSLFAFCPLFISTLAGAQETERFQAINKAFLTAGSKTVLITAHRGVHNECPENSLTAFKKGIELGIDIIELDIRHTKDDSLVIMHDRTVDRTTNGKGQVADLTFAEIRKLRLMFNGEPTEERVPTLAEALKLAKGNILVDLDIKTDRVPAIMEVVARTGTETTCIYFLGRGVYAKLLKERQPGARTLVRTHRESDVDSLFAVTKTEAVHIDPSHNTTAVTRKIKAHGGRVHINALGETDKEAAKGNPAAYGELLKFGADIIQTDYPALLLAYLKSTGRHY